MSYSSTILADSPIRYYRLGEASGTVAHDLGSQGQNGTITGGVTLGQPGLLAGDSDTAMLFNGTSGVISVPTTGLPTGASPWSIEAWVKMPSPLPASGAFPTLLLFGTTNTNQAADFFYRGSTGQFELDSWSSTVVTSGSVTVTAGGVFHLVATYDGTTAKLYVNGSQVGSASFTFNIVSGSAQLGNDTAGDFWSGVIDEAALYAVALSSAQVAAHYAAGIPAPPTHYTSVTWVARDLQAIWKTRG